MVVPVFQGRGIALAAIAFPPSIRPTGSGNRSPRVHQSRRGGDVTLLPLPWSKTQASDFDGGIDGGDE
jgi:hypothetical protein